jgi:hypothetical protein
MLADGPFFLYAYHIIIEPSLTHEPYASAQIQTTSKRMQDAQHPVRHAHYTPPPPPSHNGGLYTGEPFLPGAPWKNYPATPDTSHLIHVNLRSAHPPLEALYTYPAGGHRPGNNYSPMPGIRAMGGAYPDILCGPDIPPAAATKQNQRAQRFSKYAYL